MKRKIISILIAAGMMVTSCIPAFAGTGEAAFPDGFANFAQNNHYSDQFHDVSDSSWYYPSVKLCYEYSLMNGNGYGFSPGGSLTVAEAIVMADRVHEIYTTGKSALSNGRVWYQPYVDYAMANGIISSGDFVNYTDKITRADMAYIFANALPDEGFIPLNSILSIPDVTGIIPPYENEITKLYESGILRGSNAFGEFRPFSNITRAEAAAIISRVALPDERICIDLLDRHTLFGNMELAVPQSSVFESDPDMLSFYDSELDLTVVCGYQDISDGSSSIQEFSPDYFRNSFIQSVESSGDSISVYGVRPAFFGHIPAYLTTYDYTQSNGDESFRFMLNYIHNGKLYTIVIADLTNLNLNYGIMNVMLENLSVSGHHISYRD